jgi:hypothetical protein
MGHHYGAQAYDVTELSASPIGRSLALRPWLSTSRDMAAGIETIKAPRPGRHPRMVAASRIPPPTRNRLFMPTVSARSAASQPKR